MRTTYEETQQNIKTIISTAIEIFSEKGYDATNMREIAEAANISRGPLYYHFKNKADLYKSAVESQINLEIQEYRRIFGQDKHILELIRDDLYFCTRDIRASVKNLFFSFDKNPEFDGVSEMINLYRNTIYNIKINSVKKAISKGEIKPDTNPRHIVNMMFIFYEGLNITTQQNGLISSIEEANDAIESIIFLFKFRYCI